MKAIIFILTIILLTSCGTSHRSAYPMVKKHKQRVDFYGNKYHWERGYKQTKRVYGFEAEPF